MFMVWFNSKIYFDVGSELSLKVTKSKKFISFQSVLYFFNNSE
jgi:hypothetical protein